MIAISPDVTEHKVGDSVMSTFFRDRQDGAAIGKIVIEV